jgi:hypothetical protein
MIERGSLSAVMTMQAEQLMLQTCWMPLHLNQLQRRQITELPRQLALNTVNPPSMPPGTCTGLSNATMVTHTALNRSFISWRATSGAPVGPTNLQV